MRSSRKFLPPPVLPCGCDSRYALRQVNILQDGTRNCRCGKYWVVAWIEEVRAETAATPSGTTK